LVLVLIQEKDLEKSSQIISAFEDSKVVYFGIAAIGAGDKRIPIGLDFKQPRQSGARHR
jgi:hypothetical protein